MTSRGAQSGVSAFALVRLYRPAEVAEALGCSEWWVKEQARKGRIPFTRAGGCYRFTAEHYEEIIRVFEERPLRRAEPSTAERGRVAQPVPVSERPAARLRARRPQRAQRPGAPAA
ncbi:helix-turn-helix domain-containing protein [Streptomyces mesophilus]|uniref:helix-turn-helix domain-containing protein n=1 Tax=Streptomyces mesophilus TaxID=1775132 RepID=UPI003330E10A